MNFSGLTRTASPMLQLNACTQMRVQYSIFMVINAQMNLIGCSKRVLIWNQRSGFEVSQFAFHSIVYIIQWLLRILFGLLR